MIKNIVNVNIFDTTIGVFRIENTVIDEKIDIFFAIEVVTKNKIKFIIEIFKITNLNFFI